MTANAGLTRTLAEHVASVSVARLPVEVRAMSCTVIADALACGMAGSRLAPEVVGPVAAISPVVADGPATSLLHHSRVDPVTAAFVNGSTIHSIDYDDTHMAVVSHFGASVVAAALAAGQVVGASHDDLLAAVVAGFEAGARVGRACMPQHYERWHATGSLGGLAAAAAAARALGLDGAQTEMALGLAADDTSGTRVAIAQGDISKSLHAGLAAQRGVRSALLVLAGARGPVGHLEHPYGFFWAYSDERDARRLPERLADLGARWEILEDDIKAYPCILSSHTAIEAVIQIAREHDLNPANVLGIELVQPRYSENHGMNREPATAMAARLSVPYCVTVALEDRTVGMAQFTGDRWLDPDVRDRMARVQLGVDEGLRDRYPGQAPNVTRIVTVTGDLHTREIGVAKGSHERPLAPHELRIKHDELLRVRLDDQSLAHWQSLMTASDEAGWLDRWDRLVLGSVTRHV